MPVRRRYACEDCNHEWLHLHMRSDEPLLEDCPVCAAHAAATRPTTFAITTVKAKAVDMAQQIMEQDYGLTDARDNLREGDSVVKAPAAPQTAEAEALTQMMIEQARETSGIELNQEQAAQVKQFWQTGGAGVGGQVAQSMAAPGAVAARQDGSDPVALLHKGEQAALGAGPQTPLAQSMRLQVVGKAKVEDVI